MRVLVLGGTRFIGPFVVRNLVDAGHEVTIFHRGTTEAELPQSVRRIQGDRGQIADSMAEIRAASPDVALDMIPYNGDDAETIVDALRDITPRIVALSSQDVYRAYGRLIGVEPGPPDRIPLTENSPLRTKLFPYKKEGAKPPDEKTARLWEYDKIPAERAFLRPGGPAGTILRLPMIYGPGDGQHRLFPYLKRMDDGRSIIIVGNGIAAWRWTRAYVEDVADAVVRAVTDERAAGRVYNVGDEPIGMAEWIRLIGRVVGWKGDVLILPEERLPESMRTGMNTAQALVSDSTRIREELGWSETVPREEGLRRTIEWERAHPPDPVDPAQFDYAAEDAVLRDLGRRGDSARS